MTMCGHRSCGPRSTRLTGSSPGWRRRPPRSRLSATAVSRGSLAASRSGSWTWTVPDMSSAAHMAPREVLPLVVADLHERIEVGVQTYGSPLAVESENDALRFAYEEALDLTLYLRQELERRG